MPRSTSTRNELMRLGGLLKRLADAGNPAALQVMKQDRGGTPRVPPLGCPPGVPPPRTDTQRLALIRGGTPRGNRVSPKGREGGELPGLSVVRPEIQGLANRLTQLARRCFKGIRLSDADPKTAATIGRWLDNGPRTEKQAREFVYLRAARGSWDGGSKSWRPWKGSLHRLFDETRWFAERHANPTLEPTYEHLKREYTEAWPTWLAEIIEENGDAENGRAVVPGEETGPADASGSLRFAPFVPPARVFRS